MGTWGSGAFDNDDAADWAWQLTDDADEAVVAAALTAVESSTDPAAPASQVAVAAAEVVAAGLGRPAADLPDDVAAWVASRTERRWAALAPLALRSIARVAAGSELRDLWAESDATDATDATDEWSAVLLDLATRLRSPST
jgi:uncharacterized protein DUF4259